MRKTGFLLFIILTALLLTSCSGLTEADKYYDELVRGLETATPQPEAEAPRANTQRDPLKRYLTLTTQGVYDEIFLRKHVKQYMELHPNVEITVDVIAVRSEDYSSTLSVQLMAGQVGDIVSLAPDYDPKVLSDVYFMDLNEFIRNDAAFTPERYFMNIISAFEEKGKLYCIPPTFVPWGDMMMRNDIAEGLAERFTSGEIISYNDAIIAYLEVLNSPAYAESPEKWEFMRSFCPMYFLYFNIDRLIDLESKKAHFTDPVFMELLEQVKEIPIDPGMVQYTPEKLIWMSEYREYEWGLGDLVNAKEMHMFKDINFGNYTATSLYPYASRIFTMPRQLTTAGGHYMFSCECLMTINKNCEDPELAWDFIKFLLRDQPAPETSGLQTHLVGDILRQYRYDLGVSFPVNRANFNTRWNLELDYAYDLGKDWDMTCDKENYKADAMAHLTEMVERLDLPHQKYYKLFSGNFLWPDLYLYLTDKQSVDITMLNIQNKVELWLNE